MSKAASSSGCSSVTGEAGELMAKAEKKLKGWSLFGGGSKYEEAFDMYQRAGNLLKAQKNWMAAGEAFTKAAECQVKLESKHEAATSLIEAGNCYRKQSSTDAATSIRQAVDLYIDMGKFSMAAKYEKEIAEIFEAEGEIEKACEHFTQAADYFSGEEQSSQANACNTKLATLYATLGQYDKAAELFEKVGAASLDNNLLKWGVKDLLFKAAICLFAAADGTGEGIELAKIAVEKYQEMDLTLAGTRELALLHAIGDAVSERDPDAFTNAVADFDSIQKLDQWKTSVLLKIKKSIATPDVL